MTRDRLQLSVRRVLELLSVILAVWLAAAIFNTSEFYRRSIVRGGMVFWDEVLYYQLTTSLHWAAWTPLAMLLADLFPIRAPHRLRNALVIGAIIPPLALVRSALGGVVLQLGEGTPVTFAMMALSVGIRWHRYIFIFLVIIVMTNFLRMQREAIARDRKAFALEAALARAETEQLRAQLHPTFLFGALEAIRTHVRTDPSSADRIIVSLSSLLRRSLDFRQRSSITLEEELDFVDRYMDIQRARLGAISMEMDVSDSVLRALVTPQSIQQPIDEVLSRIRNSSPAISVTVKGTHQDDRLRINTVIVVEGEDPVVSGLDIPYRTQETGVAA